MVLKRERGSTLVVIVFRLRTTLLFPSKGNKTWLLLGVFLWEARATLPDETAAAAHLCFLSAAHPEWRTWTRDPPTPPRRWGCACTRGNRTSVLDVAKPSRGVDPLAGFLDKSKGPAGSPRFFGQGIHKNWHADKASSAWTLRVAGNKIDLTLPRFSWKRRPLVDLPPETGMLPLQRPERPWVPGLFS